MQGNVQKYALTDRVEHSVNQLLRNWEMLQDEDWAIMPEARLLIEQLACSRENFVCSSFSMGITEADSSQQILFGVCRDPFKDFQDVMEAEIRQISQNADKMVLRLAFFVDSMKTRVSVERRFDRKACQAVRNKINRELGGKKILSMHATCILLKDYPRRTVALKHLKHYEMIQEPPVDTRFNLEKPPAGKGSAPEDAAVPLIQAVTFTSDLYQLVDLYDMIGEALFQNNVRFGIEEEMGVDQAIRRTLSEEPEMFWFKNNGVTILVENASACFGKTEELILGEIGPGKVPNFSVVNGAQTITTAARYFYQLEDRKACAEKDGGSAADIGAQLDRVRQLGRVLVRVIYIRADENGGQAKDLSKAISVALNRQKPIHIEDIAFTTPEVSKLADCLENMFFSEGKAFRLIRRGEDAGADRHMELVEFARARVACAGRPGIARARGMNELLRLDSREDGKRRFAQSELFADDWLDAEGDAERAVFQRDYGAVWFAHQVSKEYGRQRKRFSEREFLNVLNNGKWYFIAVLTRVLNGFRPDFQHFCTDHKSVADNIPKAMELFAGIVLLFLRRDSEEEPDSNLFKNETLYEGLLKGFQNGFSMDDSKKEEQINRKAQAFAALFDAELSWHNVPADDGGGEDSYVTLKDHKIFVKHDAQAFAQIAEYVLNTYPVADGLEEACGSWLTVDSAVARAEFGYFRGSPRFVRTKTSDFWVGTSSSTKSKQRQLKNLCRLAGVGEGEILWVKKGEVIFASGV
ncbi:MAG: hypothetical protein HFI93_00695 [Lachnospiraceae bacterium]|nr:hypothetical protein [Lachnospiraceae bacterium]